MTVPKLAAWQALYPGDVHSVRVVRETGRLPELLPKLDALREALERLEAKAAKAKAAEQVGDGCFGGGDDTEAKRAKALDKLARQIAKQQAKIDAVRCEVADERNRHCALPEHDAGVSYFVLFKTARAATIAKQVVNVPNAHFEVGPAPTPSSVSWSSLTATSERARYPSSAAAAAAYIAVLFLWAMPIGFVSSLMNLDTLYKYLPFLEDVLNWLGPQATSFVSAFLPTLALIIFLALLPPFCLWCAGMEKHASTGRVQAAAFGKLFTFNFIWTFLGLSIGSSLFNSMTAILEQARHTSPLDPPRSFLSSPDLPIPRSAHISPRSPHKSSLSSPDLRILEQPSELLSMLANGLANTSATYMCILIIYTPF